MRMKKITIALFSLTCVACSAEQHEPQQLTGDYQTAVRIAVKKTLIDPYSVRDVAISKPRWANGVFDGVIPFPHSGHLVCIRLNAKNRFGGYTGAKSIGFLFNNGAIERIIAEEDAPAIAHHCGEFQPFNL